jgi:membrane fusion protein, multidrug efflux system
VSDEHKVNPPERASLLFYLAALVSVAVIVGLVAGLIHVRGAKLAQESGELGHELAEGPRVVVTPVLEAESARTVEIPATMHGYIETAVYAKIAGYLETITVDKGDRVKKDQVMATLVSPELDQQVANARASYHLALITDQRNQPLARDGAIPQQTADQSHDDLLAAKATLDQLEALGAYKTIAAPFDAVVTARYVDPGALIPQATSPATSTPIITIATLSPLRIYADAPQNVAPFIRDGDPAIVTVDEYPGREFRGSVTRHPEALNIATRTMLVEVDLPNRDSALYPGMYGLMKLTISGHGAGLLVPDDALIYREGNPYVPVVRENKLRLIPVTLGEDDGVHVKVTGDITGHDVVALSVGQAAQDGEKVRPVSVQELPH